MKFIYGIVGKKEAFVIEADTRNDAKRALKAQGIAYTRVIEARMVFACKNCGAIGGRPDAKGRMVTLHNLGSTKLCSKCLDGGLNSEAAIKKALEEKEKNDQRITNTKSNIKKA